MTEQFVTMRSPAQLEKAFNTAVDAWVHAGSTSQGQIRRVIGRGVNPPKIHLRFYNYLGEYKSSAIINFQLTIIRLLSKHQGTREDKKSFFCAFFFFFFLNPIKCPTLRIGPWMSRSRGLQVS